MRSALLAALICPPLFCAALPLAGHAEDAPAPKLGPNAVLLSTDNAYLRGSPAPDYWALSSFVKPQFTTSACGVASVTAAVNGLAGLPANAEDTVMSQPELLDLVGDDTWKAISAEGGDGVKFEQLVEYASKAMAARGLNDSVTVFHPADSSPTPTPDQGATLREWLAANEASASDALLVYFNQGVVTGDWDGPHVSVIGAYDAAADRVLILEVDQEWYTPYWTPVDVLLDAMLKPTSAEHGVLEGQTGGLVRLAL
ncbi:phytochelatin synthase family protein [Paenirhodobacter sp. CAU 1674]|uniref:phytochelatin synthase family protein n=1 Tax=Paenirhodobacter sp. CAU 1674 TaxID=3032596 RepID=UPI0023DA49F6|nr:phytochelatin synthase family protein [Paenirhodobacter sp. CAU 1674]MDF2143127.1 phytochelatin synthase family protein [Paenirhodobacter sp. CAU 1674]